MGGVLTDSESLIVDAIKEGFAPAYIRIDSDGKANIAEKPFQCWGAAATLSTQAHMEALLQEKGCWLVPEFYNNNYKKPCAFHLFKVRDVKTPKLVNVPRGVTPLLPYTTLYVTNRFEALLGFCRLVFYKGIDTEQPELAKAADDA
tara:strand:- start:1176 stop:1613 length:438 start_codon:yes stop_codon:yes gene_type:complete